MSDMMRLTFAACLLALLGTTAALWHVHGGLLAVAFCALGVIGLVATAMVAELAEALAARDEAVAAGFTERDEAMVLALQERDRALADGLKRVQGQMDDLLDALPLDETTEAPR